MTAQKIATGKQAEHWICVRSALSEPIQLVTKKRGKVTGATLSHCQGRRFADLLNNAQLLIAKGK